MRKHYQDLNAITNEQTQLDMLEAIGFEMAQQILELNEDNMKQLRYWIDEIIEKADKEKDLLNKNKPINPNHPALLVNK